MLFCMPFVKGHAKIGGRQSGVTPRKRTTIILSTVLCRDPRVRLEELGIDPLRVLAELALDPEVENGVRRLAASDLASFVWPRKKSVEHIGNVELNLNVGNPREALAARIAGIRERAGGPQLLPPIAE